MIIEFRPARMRGARGWTLGGMLLILTGAGCTSRTPVASEANPVSDQAAAPDPGTARGTSDAESSAGIILSALDPRLEPLLKAAEKWRRQGRPGRKVVDQVYLVPDVASFFEAIAAWDDRSYFPILLDDPAWSLPFLRAFRPSRVVRFRSESKAVGRRPPDAGLAKGGGRERPTTRWADALRAVSRAWTADDVPDQRLPSASLVPKQLGAVPPGIVLSHPDSPMLAAAVALAAGRFQPLIQLDPIDRPAEGNRPATASPSLKFGDVLPLRDALIFARRIEVLAESVTGASGGLGDACDFLTLAGDWPYRYRNELETGRSRGDYALDDLIGRVLEAEEGSPANSRRRWAFAGRILGSPAASLYRAMCALFLQPEQSLLWNTYGTSGFWNQYAMAEPARVLERLRPGVPPPTQRTRKEADLPAWHRTVDPASRFGWVMINSSGGGGNFTILGGTGRPSDLPRSVPAVVSMIHSFSATNPLDGTTLAGRWLENGAFVYFGSMQEPYLQSFRPPRLVLELAAADVPLSAAFRQGESEAFGRPWRLAYLGDPLYTLRPSADGNPVGPGRLRPGPWQPLEADGRGLGGASITAATALRDLGEDGPARLETCWIAFIRSLCRHENPAPDPDRRDWRAVLAAMDRGRLNAALRGVLDELTIDAMLQAGDATGLLDHLLRLPIAELSPRTRFVIESLAMGRLTGLASSGSFESACDLWDRVMVRPWPRGCRLPSDLTERLVDRAKAASASDRALCQQRLRASESRLVDRADLKVHREIVARELKRLEPPASSKGG